MKIYVIRHGKTDINALKLINSLNDEDLNETGIKQALDTSLLIKNINYDLIFSSPLTRTLHTANIINIKNKKIITDDRLLERNAGILTKTKVSSLDLDDSWNINPKNNYYDAESVNEIITRVYSFLDEIKIKYFNKNIIIVTHYGVCKAIDCYFNGIPDDGNLQKIIFRNCEVKEYEL